MELAASSQPSGESQPLQTSVPLSAPPVDASRVTRSWRLQHVRFCYVIVALGLVIIGGSLAVGLYYSIARDRMGDGFTTASWMVAVGTLVLAAPMAKHYPHCKCWDKFGVRVLP
jgi:hypothetical protein